MALERHRHHALTNRARCLVHFRSVRLHCRDEEKKQDAAHVVFVLQEHVFSFVHIVRLCAGRQSIAVPTATVELHVNKIEGTP